MTIRLQYRFRLAVCLSLVGFVAAPVVLAAPRKPAQNPAPKPATNAPAKPPALPVLKLPPKPATNAPPKATTPAAPAAPAGPTVPPAEAFENLEKLFQEGKYSETLAKAREFQKVYWFSGLQQGAIYYEGWAAFSLKQYPDAINAFDNLIKTYAGSDLAAEAWLKKAECLRETKDYDRALKAYSTFATEFPKHRLEPQALLGAAMTHFAKKDIPAAKQMLTRYRNLAPAEWRENMQGLFLYAQILNEEKNFQEAQTIYEAIAARSDNPLIAEGIYLAAQNLFDAKQYKQALNFFKRVPSLAALLDAVDRQLAAHNANRTAFVAQRGVDAFNAQVQALQARRSQWQSRPDLRPSALYRVANCYQLLDRMEEATIVYRFLMDKYPTNPIGEQAHYGLIEAMMERKQMDAANKEIELFKTKYPNSALFESTTIRQAEALFSTKQYEQALPLYRKAKESTKEPKVIEAADFRIALCFSELGQWDKALTAYTDFIAAHPESKALPDALFRQGRCYYELALVSKDPAAAKSLLEKSIVCFQTIQTKYPTPETLPEVVFQLAFAYINLATYEPTALDSALVKLQEFIDNWPNHRFALEVLFLAARTYGAQQKFDPAIDTYNKIISNFPDDPKAAQATYERASIYAAAGKTDEMVKELAAFVEKFPDHPKAGDALYTIAGHKEDEARRLLTGNDEAGANAKFKEAEAVYQQVIASAAKAPASEENKNLRDAAIGAQMKIIALQEQRKAFDEAIAGCDKFLQQFATYPVAGRQIVNQIAGLYRRAKQPAKAFAKLEELRSQYQANSGIRIAALTAITELAIAEGDNLRANQSAAQLLADPEAGKLPAVTFIAIGETLLKTEQCERAREAYLKMQAAFANDAPIAQQAVLGLARSALCLKQFDEAEKWFRQVADTPPAGQNADAELGLGRVAEARGNIKEAVDRYNAVLKLTRGDAADQAAFQLGHLFINMKEADPKKAKDNAKAALAYFARLILSTGPMAEEAFYMLGVCHERVGSADWSRASYQNYLKRFPDGKFGERAKERLKAIGAPKK